jgi:hypothetical protein
MSFSCGLRAVVFMASGRWCTGILAISPRFVSPQMRIGDAQQWKVFRFATGGAAALDQVAEDVVGLGECA